MKIVKKTADLQKPCEDATEAEGFEIIDLLEETLSLEKGIGLAANQIGIQKKVCIVRVPIKESIGMQSFGFNFINPTITHLEDPFLFKDEGCLSFPNEFIETIRYDQIIVSDLLEPEGRGFSGLPAVAIQHEVDHLLGKTMYDSRFKSIGPNGKCPCLSGKKFKKCCMFKLKK